MALLFQRVARNLACNGYYPTDPETLRRILSALMPCEEGHMRIFDPCAGEGVALAKCQQHLGFDCTLSYGIEYDKKRAWEAKLRLNICIHSDVYLCEFEPKAFGLLFLNPPYGNLLREDQQGIYVQRGRQRLEKQFYQRTVNSLMPGGILVLIIPYKSLDEEFSRWIASSFEEVSVYQAATTRYKQVVVLGKRRPSTTRHVQTAVQQQLEAIGKGNLPPPLPEVWSDLPYVVPAGNGQTIRFCTWQMDSDQLLAEIAVDRGLWPQFTQHFGQQERALAQPLMRLSPWHGALMLAAGAVSGTVTSAAGETFVIKGDTYKEVVERITFEETSGKDTEAQVVEVRTLLDKFVPVIKALDMTEGSLTYGQIFTVR